MDKTNSEVNPDVAIKRFPFAYFFAAVFGIGGAVAITQVSI